MNSSPPVTLTLIAIMKNESRIIERCLNSVKNVVDHIVLSDTGSTDNTIELAQNFLRNNNIPGKVYQDVWENFGVNRTKSVLNGQAWLEENKINKEHKENNYFITIDCDMCLTIENGFDKNKLVEKDAWLMRQINQVITYYNVRLFRASLPYKSISVTHEYWGCDGPVTQDKLETLCIQDIGDGGSKSDKYTRDIKLLTKGIEDEPNNVRYYFYLAQSYNDIGDYENSIRLYKKRISMGGWTEEHFIAYLRLGEMMMKLNREAEGICEWIKGYEAVPQRSESLYRIINHYRNRGKNSSAYLFIKEAMSIDFPKDMLLFIEHGIYNWKIVEEMSIVGYYINKKKQAAAACQFLLLDKGVPHDTKNMARDNNYFYITKPNWTSHAKLEFPEINDVYKPSSSCLFPCTDPYRPTVDGIQGVVRAVNYSISKEFQYTIRDPQNVVRTKNYWIQTKKGVNECYEIECTAPTVRTSHISGLEDLRMAWVNDKPIGLAVDWERGKHNHPSVVITHFNKINKKYVINKVVPTLYKQDECQKNWVPFSDGKKLLAIYSHHPLTILEMNTETGECKTVVEKFSRYDLSSVRGSSIPIQLNDGSWLVIVHEIVHKNTRKYYNRFLKYSKTWELLEVSYNWYFQELFVEFTTSLMYSRPSLSGGGIITIPFSTEDNTCEMVTLPEDQIPWLPQDIKGWLKDNI
jgi:glycosyltransferase involved in cell wall biosynthesis